MYLARAAATGQPYHSFGAVGSGANNSRASELAAHEDIPFSQAYAKVIGLDYQAPKHNCYRRLRNKVTGEVLPELSMRELEKDLRRKIRVGREFEHAESEEEFKQRQKAEKKARRRKQKRVEAMFDQPVKRVSHLFTRAGRSAFRLSSRGCGCVVARYLFRMPFRSPLLTNIATDSEFITLSEPLTNK